eukprot:1034029_1
MPSAIYSLKCGCIRKSAFSLVLLTIVSYVLIYNKIFLDNIPPMNSVNYVTLNNNQDLNELLNQIGSLALANIELKKENAYIQIENRALRMQKESFISHHNATHAYYLLYGYCSSNTNPMYGYHHIMMRGLKRLIWSKYPHWIIVNISVEAFLDGIAQNNYAYSHSKLLDFTTINAPFIDLHQDKFQWMFEPCCERKFAVNKNSKWLLNIKQYYHDNQVLNMVPPLTLKQYFWIQFNRTDIIDDNDRELLSHVVSVNKHKYDNYSIDMNDEDRLSNVWHNNTYISSTIHHLQSLQTNRPLLLFMSGEVFDAWKIRRQVNHHGHATDIHLERTFMAKTWLYFGSVCTRNIAKRSNIQPIISKRRICFGFNEL